jgi:hypothetical protein
MGLHSRCPYADSLRSLGSKKTRTEVEVLFGLRFGTHTRSLPPYSVGKCSQIQESDKRANLFMEEEQSPITKGD